MIEVWIREVGKIELREVDEPVAAGDEAVVSVSAAGICGSDMHVFEGRNPGLSPPHLAGHEFGGVVTELNGSAPGIAVGDRVAVNPVLSCGSCEACRSGARYLCSEVRVIGGAAAGAMREKIAVPAKNLVKLPDDFDFGLISLVEPLANVLHFADSFRGGSAVIVGLGTIGLLTLQIAKLNGNTTVCCDIQDQAIAQARGLGADLVFDFREQERLDVASSFIGSQGADVVFDVVCSEDTLAFSTRIAKKHGAVVVVGIAGGPVPVTFRNIIVKELTITSTYMFCDYEFSKAANMLVGGIIDGPSLITKSFPMREAAEAFEYKATTPAAKVVLTN